MSMLAPFEVKTESISDLVETLKEEIDTFYFGDKTNPMLAFTGVGVYEHKKKSLLYLNPDYDIDLQYCSEMVIDICKSFIPHQVKYKANKHQFLPLGVFKTKEELNLVLDQAKLEFSSNSQLAVESISIYQNKMGIWSEIDVLADFEENNNQFLQLNNPTL